MTEIAGGSGSANDATAVTEDGPTDLEEAERARRKAEGDALGKQAAIEAADDAIAAAQAKVEKAEGHLAGAKDALATAQAERKELD